MITRGRRRLRLRRSCRRRRLGGGTRRRRRSRRTPSRRRRSPGGWGRARPGWRRRTAAYRRRASRSRSAPAAARRSEPRPERRPPGADAPPGDAPLVTRDGVALDLEPGGRWRWVTVDDPGPQRGERGAQDMGLGALVDRTALGGQIKAASRHIAAHFGVVAEHGPVGVSRAGDLPRPERVGVVLLRTVEAQ